MKTTTIGSAVYLMALFLIQSTASLNAESNNRFKDVVQVTESRNTSLQLRTKSVDGKRSVEDDCSIATERGETIIKTKESRAAGAVYIASPPVANREECIAECCRSTSCDTAILKEKDQQLGCYLFNCGLPSICLFSVHPGYSAVLIAKSVVHPISSLSQPEAEKNVNELVHVASSVNVVSTTATPTVSSSQARGKALYGFCQSGEDCPREQHLECLKGYCLCQEGYHIVESACRADCNRFQFECSNKDEPSLSECIAVYDRCNGIAQCRDESDELLCSDQHTTGSNWQMKPERPTQNAPDRTAGRSTQPTFGNSSYESQPQQASVVKAKTANDLKLRPVESANDRSVSRGMSRTSDIGRPESSPRNTDDLTSLGSQKDDSAGDTFYRRPADGQFENPAKAKSSPFSRDSIHSSYQSRISSRFDQDSPASEGFSADGKLTAVQTAGKEESKVNGLVEGKPLLRGEPEASQEGRPGTVSGVMVKPDQHDDIRSRFTSIKDKLGFGMDDSSVRTDGSRTRSDSVIDTERHKSETGSIGGSLIADEKSKNIERYSLEGVPESADATKLGYRTEKVASLLNGDYVKGVKLTDRYQSSVEESLSKLKEDQRLQHEENERGRLFEKYQNKLEYGSSDLISDPISSSSDSRFEKFRGRPSSESAAPSKLLSPISRVYETKPSQELQSKSRSGVLDPGQSQWTENSRLQPFIAKPSREKDISKASQPRNSDLPTKPDASESMLKGRIRAQHPIQIQDAGLVDSKDLERYQDHGDSTFHGNSGGRFRQLDPNRQASGASLDRYPAGVAVDSSIDRSSQMYGYSGQYSNADTLSNQYADGQPDPGMPYDGGHIVGQPIGHGQYDTYGDNAYGGAEDYFYAAAPRQSAHGYGRPASGLSDYDYYNGGPPSPPRKAVVKYNLAGGSNGRRAQLNAKVTRMPAIHSADAKVSSSLRVLPAANRTTTAISSTTTARTETTSLTSSVPPSLLPTSKQTVQQSTTVALLTTSSKSQPVTHKLNSSPKSEMHKGYSVAAEDRSHHERDFWSTPQTRGAVVALSLGIVITATMLLYAGCRFRRMRKMASRRRRPVGNSDADYLVNGMYL